MTADEIARAEKALVEAALARYALMADALQADNFTRERDGQIVEADNALDAACQRVVELRSN